MGTKNISTVIHSDVVEIKDDQKLLALQAPVKEDNTKIDTTKNNQVKKIDSIEKTENFFDVPNMARKSYNQRPLLFATAIIADATREWSCARKMFA